MANNLADELRKLKTARRDAGRERSLQAAIDQSHSQLQCLLPDAGGTPSIAAVRAERGVQLAQALAALPEAQRQVIELHHLQSRTLVEVAEVRAPQNRPWPAFSTAAVIVPPIACLR